MSNSGYSYREHPKTAHKNERLASIYPSFERTTLLNSCEKPITDSIFPEGTTELIVDPRFQNKNSTLSHSFYARIPKSSQTAYRFVGRLSSQNRGAKQDSKPVKRIQNVYGIQKLGSTARDTD